MSQDYQYDRNGVWYYYRRVPKEYRAFEPGELILQTTGHKVANDPRGRESAKLIAVWNARKEAYWRARARGEPGTIEAADYARSVRVQKAKGFVPRQIEDITDPVDVHNRLAVTEEELTQFQAWRAAGGHNGGPPIDTTTKEAFEVAAVNGLIPRVTMRVSQMPAACFELLKTSLTGKAKFQVRKWQGVRTNAAAQFIEAVDDVDLSIITRKEMRQFRDWLKVRVEAGKINANTANTTISAFTKMVALLAGENQEEWEVGEDGGMDLDTFVGFKLPKPRKKKKERLAYSNGFIQNVLLAEGAFDKPFFLHKHAKSPSRLSREAIRIYYIMIESGMSTSEIVGLETKYVFPEGGSVPGERPLPAEYASIPYVALRPIGRELKTANRERDVVLVGVALAAIKAQLADLPPDETRLFPQYFQNPNYWAQHMSAYIRQNNLKEVDSQVVYCIRHSFKDRLLNSNGGSDAKMHSLMGHGGKTPHYGDGLALKNKYDWVNHIAFPAFPAEV
jgi:integrase